MAYDACLHLLRPPPPRAALFPYTTLFRSSATGHRRGVQRARDRALDSVPLTRMVDPADPARQDRKSTRLNSSHVRISYAVFCLNKKKILRAFNVSWRTAPADIGFPQLHFL